jgi:hypothetical protein
MNERYDLQGCLKIGAIVAIGVLWRVYQQKVQAPHPWMYIGRRYCFCSWVSKSVVTCVFTSLYIYRELMTGVTTTHNCY